MLLGEEEMVVLPGAEKAQIPIEKLTRYSLDLDKDFNKATAFRLALGYSKENASRLVSNILANIVMFNALYKGHNGFGEIYECIMRLTGENGKAANVLTGWIVEDGTDYPRLTNVYVTKRHVGGK